MTNSYDAERLVERDDLAKWQLVFVEKKADFITVDGWVGRPAREQVARAVEAGWLVEDEATSRRQSDEQYTAVCFRPTDKLLRSLATDQTK